MDSIIDDSNNMVTTATDNNVTVSTEGSISVEKDEKNILKERTEQNKIIKEQLKKQIQDCSNSEAFNNFTKTQKKQSKKKVIVTSIFCMFVIALGAGVIYFKIFARIDIQRGTELDMTYNEVMQSEKYKYDSKEPDSFGDIMLCYSGVKYRKLKGDAFYYFDAPKGEMYVMSMKFEYSEDTYSYLLDSLSKEYGSYTMGEYNVSYPDVAMWRKGDKLISVLVSKDSSILEVVVEYS